MSKQPPSAAPAAAPAPPPLPTLASVGGDAPF